MTDIRSDLPDRLYRVPVVAVLRAGEAGEYLPVIESLVSGGLLSIELTLSTRGVFKRLPELVAEFDRHADIGVGTVTTLPEAERAMDAGAAFIVTPVTSAPITEACVARGVPVFPGAFSPTEVHTAWSAGATAVKVFPAATVGAGYLRQLHGPFPDLRVVPSGGLDIEGCRAWMQAGAAAVSVGGPLLGDAFSGGALTALSARTRVLIDTVQQARATYDARSV